MAERKGRGLVAPVFTPINEDQTINYHAIPGYMKFLAASNIKSILVNGTSGEGVNQNVEERKRVAEAWIKAARPLGVQVMVQVGGAPLPDVLELAKHAESIKVDSILTLPELYFKPRSIDELVSYLELVSAAAPSLPIAYYHFPMHSGVDIDVPTLVSVASRKMPLFRGVKCNLSEGAEVIYRGHKDIVVYLGTTSVLAPAFSSGFDSSIATLFNILPGLSQETIVAANNSDFAKAQELQQKLNKFTEILRSEGGTWVPAMKVGMELVTGVKVGRPRLPLTPLTPEQRSRVEGKLRASGFIV